ncbi:aldo/keto reductase [Alicyclobacillus fastidiosus]|uniref:Aldo/keto reductase n=1 Tax=Alicyclobacillus fastidiosus TaxID=392011 RepID=A0ABY6ZCI8_9BACL|nr:aldo/keto reductase [Alicyclobacillus fastidiosus]WAH39830.1 aldo/keto reductase [Alicyclobacillus fastidiosus]GMA61087.1 oxidoreductase [Alicyclobacillus fastidiosus]
MEYRKLGVSNLQLGTIGLGCWAFGGGSYWGEQNQKDVDRVVHEALECGINYFDTAEVYNEGASEISLGKALQGRRNEAIVGTKITPANTEPATLRKHCEESLARLNTDYIDVYVLHWPISPHSIEHFSDDARLFVSPPSIDEAFHTLRSLQAEGKIREIAISNHGVKQMKQVLGTGTKIVANQLAYNLLSRAIESSILPLCIERGVGVIAYMPLQQGLLTGKYHRPEAMKPMQARSRHFHHTRGSGTRHGENGAEQEVFQAISEIRHIAEEMHVDMSVLALSWVISNPAVTTAIVGCRNTKQLENNLQALDCPLDLSTLSKLNDITLPVLEKLGDNPDYYENRLNSRIE